ncbi:MAG: DUF1800 domain-containing protein [Mucilaginibacter polytrichastri]|nr:DUF1800 domain-containing protein [Mucilaginibacter polytrichastri]
MAFSTAENQIKHLYSRAGFGLRYNEFLERKNWSVKKAVKHLFSASEKDEPLGVVNGDIYAMQQMQAAKQDENQKKMLIQQRNQQERNLNLGWMDLMAGTDAVLREKMVLFWHNHFACRTNRPAFAQQLNNVQRKYALGNFRDLLTEVSKTPAMLAFLNNQQNRKGHPNENFAREVMELFTLGRGNYSENDVKEGARAFTGWTYDKDGNFIFREKQHDDGTKTFLGSTGKFKGEDILDKLLAKKETATFISRKLYKSFVNETPDEAHVAEMATVFYNAKYDIGELMRFVFSADWFYAPQNVGNLIKSPVEMLVGLNRQFYITYQAPATLIQFQKTLGQQLFNPPNVAGWPGGRNWIDSSSLMYRMKIPSMLLTGGLIDFTGKADPEDEAFIAATRKRQDVVTRKLQASADWEKVLSGIPQKTSNADFATFFFEAKPGQGFMQEINAVTDRKSALVQMVSTAEYQLC